MLEACSVALRDTLRAFTLLCVLLYLLTLSVLECMRTMLELMYNFNKYGNIIKDEICYGELYYKTDLSERLRKLANRFVGFDEYYQKCVDKFNNLKNS